MKSSWGFRLTVGLAATVLVVIVLFPLYVMVVTSVKPLEEVTNGSLWPHRFDWSTYVKIWSTIDLGRYFVNSLVIALCSTAASLIVAIFAAYALSRFSFRGRHVFGLVVLATQMFPGVLFLLPLYLIFVTIQSVTGIPFRGTYWSLILTHLTFALPFSIWMLRSYLDTLPRDLEEAALLDGATPTIALFRVVIPVMLPAIAAVAVFAFLTSWNEILFASVLTNQQTRTLSVGLQSYATQQIVYWNQMMAASLVTTLPAAVGFLLVQRYIVKGLMAGSVK